jgi:hypothetical protein
MKRAFSLAMCCVTVAACLGCQPLVRTPARFLQLDERHADYQYRAVTADGVVLAARVLEVAHQSGGGLDFWVLAIKMRLRASGAYALRSEHSIKTANGLDGRQLRFARDEKQRPYQYWITIFVDGDALALVEAGGPEAQFSAYEREVEGAIRSLHP